MHVCTLGEAQMLCCDAESCSGLGLHGITQWGLLTCPRSHSWIIKLWHVKALEKEYAGSSLCFSFGWLMVASCCICIISVTSLCSFGISSCLLFVPVGEESSDLPQHSIQSIQYSNSVYTTATFIEFIVAPLLEITLNYGTAIQSILSSNPDCLHSLSLIINVELMVYATDIMTWF